MDFKKNRWICMTGAMILALCSGIGYAWSVFQKPLMENFDWALETISITFTIQVMISTIAPVFLSRFQKKLGVKKYLRLGILVYVCGLILTNFTFSIGYLYIVYGIVVGIGIAMLYPTLIAYATSLFPEKKGMGSGMLACAYGSGAILWAPIATYLMSKFDVLFVFSFLAGIFIIVMVPVTFMIKKIPDDYQLDLGKAEDDHTVVVKDFTWKEMLRTGRYYIILVALTLGTTAGLMIAGHASGMLQEILELTPAKASVFVGLFSVFNAVGRLLFGVVSDKLGRYNIMIALFIIIGCAMLVLANTVDVVFIIALLAISSCYGGFTALFSPICADNFGMKNLTVNYAFLYIAYGLAGLIGPQVAARIHSASGGYNMAFITVAVISVVGVLLAFILNKTKMQKVT